MIPLTLGEVARVTGGRVHPGSPEADDLRVTGPVVTDSREAAPGALYVARRGDVADGHDFVASAAAQGAVAALTNRVVDDLPCVVVDEDPQRLSARPDRPPYDAVTRAFAALGREVVDRCGAVGGLRVVGITGSSGKTSTKDLMAQVLPALGPTLAPEASYNSEVGVPLTVCRLTEETAYLVAEMGASGAGHIAHLTAIAPPQVSVVLNVGSAHLGEFGSRAAIMEAKSELVQALPEGGLAVLDADDEALVSTMGGYARDAGARVVLVGLGERAQVRATDVVTDERGRASFTLRAPDLGAPEGGLPVRLQLVGVHHVGNALAVAAVAHEWGMPWDRVARELGAATPRSRWRMQVTERSDGVTVVNDAYNANPESMRAALQSLAAMRRPDGRTLAVVGGMLELGADSDAEHAGVGALAAQLGVDHLLTVGELAVPAATAYREAGGARVSSVADRHEARALLDEELLAGDVVLLKSSRDSGLRMLGDELAGVGG
ncbi:UDP-N-acetylmuramoylalanyl-D-glutamyl-2,6- diaminopimelate--D-alanyl-D-alanine ligase [Serinicoccus hydrothermalis]|uniref:UDP-N-acetylmuramoyl-tripeptide--D-alanyl-D-alanine ligase n=1 Tax=Serinicoccus hydrothermalis TaxID=1758689 RepID=A0A1B1NA40_9MICO|nr:UDP-N-acetylmuramoyl-tripeptide--D-alanyl-D-alanine ligase [Serinicoccus hydrothermalis]ANS78278.1 UDP-N-acetylmuramoylalanyl-D-glutamyl-2,6- diaminopimelate--D-alanyl-D-alanine ligase [Serinicoccus hydrothermalis]